MFGLLCMYGHILVHMHLAFSQCSCTELLWIISNLCAKLKKYIHRIKISRENQRIFCMKFLLLQWFKYIRHTGSRSWAENSWRLGKQYVCSILTLLYAHVNYCIRLGAELSKSVLWPGLLFLHRYNLIM